MASSSIENILQSFRASSSNDNLFCSGKNVNLPARTIQVVFLVLFSGAMEIPLSNLGSPIFQSVIDIFEGRAQF